MITRELSLSLSVSNWTKSENRVGPNKVACYKNANHQKFEVWSLNQYFFLDELQSVHLGQGDQVNSVSLVNLRSSQLRLQVDKVDSISISVISSKTNVTVAVQNSVVR